MRPMFCAVCHDFPNLPPDFDEYEDADFAILEHIRHGGTLTSWGLGGMGEPHYPASAAMSQTRAEKALRDEARRKLARERAAANRAQEQKEAEKIWKKMARARDATLRYAAAQQRAWEARQAWERRYAAWKGKVAEFEKDTGLSSPHWRDGLPLEPLMWPNLPE